MAQYGEKRLLSKWSHAITSTEENVVHSFSRSVGGLVNLVNKSMEQASKKILTKFVGSCVKNNESVLKSSLPKDLKVLGMDSCTVVYCLLYT
jgi:hypothetical protein